MRASDRQALRVRYNFRCGYCGIREIDAGAELTIDHFQPHSRGGNDEMDNLVYCCHACNEFKGDYWQPASAHRILHPLRDNQSEHFVLTGEDVLHPLMETGAFHMQRLDLNRNELILHRREQRVLDEDRATQQATINRLLILEQRIETLQTQAAERLLKASSNKQAQRQTKRNFPERTNGKPTAFTMGQRCINLFDLCRVVGLSASKRPTSKIG